MFADTSSEFTTLLQDNFSDGNTDGWVVGGSGIHSASVKNGLMVLDNKSKLEDGWVTTQFLKSSDTSSLTVSMDLVETRGSFESSDSVTVQIGYGDSPKTFTDIYNISGDLESTGEITVNDALVGETIVSLRVRLSANGRSEDLGIDNVLVLGKNGSIIDDVEEELVIPEEESSINTAPTLADTSFTIDVNSADGTVVGTVTGNDKDSGDTLSYNIVGGTGKEVFAVNEKTGEVIVTDSNRLDYESNKSFTLDVKVTDSGNLADTATVTINLNDLNDTVTTDEPDSGSGDTDNDEPDSGGGNTGNNDSSNNTADLSNGPKLLSALNPKSNDRVFVAKGETLYVDTDTVNLGGVIVEGKLVFKENYIDKNNNGELDFIADWLLVRKGGLLEIGTKDNPYNSDVTITLDGADENVMNMGMGGRFIIASGTAEDGTESTISMHGIDGQKVSWTQLSTTAKKGSSTITLAETVDWEVGDEIVIAPSGFQAEEAEKRKIVAVNGKTVTLDKALNYEHFGKVETIGGKQFDMRAEVGLLSRNIDIQAPTDSMNSEFGAHMMFMDGSDIKISGIEVRRGGQIRKAGRYPIHWHLGGDHTGDYVKNSSIYDSFQRGIVLHGVQNVDVESNVVYNTFGHGYVFSEDGTEKGNKLKDNLGVLIKNRESSTDFSFFNAKKQGRSTQSEHRNAVFWGRNYYNTMIGNHAAGTLDGNGFHLADNRGTGSKGKAYINLNDPIIFKDNVAHSNDRDRLKLSNYSPIASGNGLFIEDTNSKGTSDIVFEGFTAYKNTVSGAWIEEDRHILKSSMLADNSSGVIMKDGRVQNTVISHQTSNTVGGTYGIDKGLVLDGGIRVILGRNEFNIQDVTFANTVGPAIEIERETQVQDGSSVSGIKYEGNTPLPLYWISKDNTSQGSFVDSDGSLLRTNESTEIFGDLTEGIDKKYFNEEMNAFLVPTKD